MSALKTLEILDLFIQEKRRLTVPEMSEMLNHPQSSVYKYVKLLKEKGLVREGNNGEYLLGYKIINLYRIFKMDVNLVSWSEEPMRRLTEKYNETTMLLVHSNLQAVCLATYSSNNKIKVASEPGEIVPLYSGASSTALLAYLDDSIVEKLYKETKIIKYTDKTITNLDEMKEHLAIIRKNGYAKSFGEFYEGAIGYGVPIFNSDNVAIAALSIAGPIDRMKDLDEKTVLEDLIATKKEIEQIL